MLADHVVVLGKSWVSHRSPMGKGSLIVCETPLQLNEMVLGEIGERSIHTIDINFNGQRKTMQAVRINRDTVCWEGSSALIKENVCSSH
ncbi:hypothetical protein [Vibrio sp. Sgm 5]|uniref:hypothetical protein n=1 Tax=Vibrio sp. Sgm 5 TaxID=2994387 RepID=UPI002248E575|nr:hypothetical protein [Vibrio sp. Sgm 5]MCX2788378.1 hypothetical protein [Vibrio sp. Sgm 5]